MDIERKKKLEKIKELGIQTYPENFLNKIMTTDALSKAEKETLREAKDVMEKMWKTVRLAGRMMTFRSHWKLSFAQLQDFDWRIQICFVKNVTEVKGLNTEEMTHHKFWEKMLDLWDYIWIEWELFKTNHGEITILVKEITFLWKALKPMPEKFHGLSDDETILRQRYLETITNQNSKNRFKLRSNIIKTIRQFLWKYDFHEVETPTLEHNATGAAAKPYFTHNNALDIDLVLRISQELPLKKIITWGFERIFEIWKAFRNEGIDPSHLPEHTHFEWYAAYWSYKENMDFTEKMIKNVFQQLELNPIIKMKNKNWDICEIDFSKKFERIDYVELIKKDSWIDIMNIKEVETLKKEIINKKISIPNMNEMGYATLVDYLYKTVSRPKIKGPAFLYNYPKAIQPLARVSDKNKDMVDQFQLLVNGWEIVKAYSELVDPIDQKQRFKQQTVEIEAWDNEAMEWDDEYITCMEYGMPPISWAGLGLDRFITILCEQDNLRDCVFFPLMRPKGN